MNHLDLCSGIGGFALAAQWAGIETIGLCEIDPWCRRVLAKHWPYLPIHDDVRTLTGEMVDEWRQERGFDSVDLLTAGYPCQPFSFAGLRAGENDDRHLWPAIAEVVSVVGPSWCIFENVIGHVTMGLESVLTRLEREGYTCWTFIIPAAAVGAPQRRDRVWIVARSNHALLANTDRQRASWMRELEHQNMQGMEGQKSTYGSGTVERAEGRNEALSSLGDQTHGLSGWMVGHRPSVIPWWTSCTNCDDLWCLRCNMHVGDCHCTETEDNLHFMNPSWAGDPLSAFAPDWENGVARVTDNSPQDTDRKNKLKGLGNAIVPQVAYMIMQSIQETLR